MWRNGTMISTMPCIFWLPGKPGDIIWIMRINRFFIWNAACVLALIFRGRAPPVGGISRGESRAGLYRRTYNRLVSLNGVGSDPRNFGVSLAVFHRANQERIQRSPLQPMTASAAKMCARLNVLSEMPAEWRNRLSRWARINRT